MRDKEVLDKLKKFLSKPEIRKIPWINCLRAAQKRYGFSEEWFVGELQKGQYGIPNINAEKE